MRRPGQSVARHRFRSRQVEQQRLSFSKRLMIGLAAILPLSVLLGGTVVFGTFQYYSSGYEAIEDVLVERPAGITRVYDRTGEVELGVLSNPTSPLSEPVPLDQISEHMINATVATEDKDYWDHPGVNPRGLFRAVRENYVGGEFGSGTGGSSITQQLVKNVYICPSFADPDDPCVAERTVDRKLREMAYAIRLELDHSKEEILNWYLNHISYAHRYVGVQAAAEGYFRKPASELTLAESALLAGIPAAPTTYHPRLNCVTDDNDACVVDEEGRITVGGATKERQEYVLERMVESGYITRLEADAAAAEVIKVYPTSTTERQNAAAFIDNQVEPRLVRMCEAGELPMLAGVEDCAASVSSGGYTVVTTLDWAKTAAAQQLIDEMVARGLERGCDCHNAAIVTIEPDTGQVTVYAPNRNPFDESDPRIGGQIDQLVEINQPGSALKPGIYLAWMDLLGKTPASTLWDTSPLPLDPEEDVVEEGIEIVNPRPDQGGEGLITARTALGSSQNVPAFRAAQEVGLSNLIGMLKRLGITTVDQNFDPTFLDHASVGYGPTIATGGANIRVIDMAYMNATLANMGVMVGLPHHARYVQDMSELKSTLNSEGEDNALAEQQRMDFQRGHLRLPDTRPLDPVVILEVRDSAGKVIYEAPEPERLEVVDAGSAWMLHSIMEDCEARWIIWSCGWSNEDTSLDVFVDGQKLPAGIKTGTQQGPQSRNDVLATWVVGYSRHAATAVWVGNATKELIQDGPAVGFASGHTSLGIYKQWMAHYHLALRDEGRVTEFLSFEDLQPANVAYERFPSPTTERGYRGGCSQRINTWMRTDIDYELDCEDGLVKLPEYKRDEAIELARAMRIPIPGYRFVAPPPRGSSDSGSSGSSQPAPTPTPVPEPESEPTPEWDPTPIPVPDDDDDSGGGPSQGGGQGPPDNPGRGQGGGREDDDD